MVQTRQQIRTKINTNINILNVPLPKHLASFSLTEASRSVFSRHRVQFSVACNAEGSFQTHKIEVSMKARNYNTMHG